MTNTDTSAARTRKAEKLLHYAEKPLKMFIQLDGFNPATYPHGAAFSGNDNDDDELFMRITDELMVGATVRVLVDPQANPDVVARLLMKFTDWWEEDSAAWRADAARRAEEAARAADELPL